MIQRTSTVGSIAAIIPGAMDYFKEIGIDYCCGGNRKLTEIISEKNLSLDTVFTKLEQLSQLAENQGKHQDFTQMSPKELCEVIVATHHTYLRRVLPEIGDLLNAVMRAHGIHHPELFKIGQLFGQLRGDLEQHLIHEELVLFPSLLTPEGLKEASLLTPEIIAEHEVAGRILVELRFLTHDFHAPEDGCATFIKVYTMLSELEDDLHRHIHLENNILFKPYDIR